MVDMACQSCVAAVNKSLEGVEGTACRRSSMAAWLRDKQTTGIQSVETELATQSVLVFGTASTERLLEALSASGRKTRLIGQGSAAGALCTRGFPRNRR
jgi:copper chaperone CopZ